MRQQKITDKQFNQLTEYGFTIRVDTHVLAQRRIRRWYFENGRTLAIIDDYPEYETWDDGPVNETNIYYVLMMHEWLWDEIKELKQSVEKRKFLLNTVIIGNIVIWGFNVIDAYLKSHVLLKSRDNFFAKNGLGLSISSYGDIYYKNVTSSVFIKIYIH